MLPIAVAAVTVAQTVTVAKTNVAVVGIGLTLSRSLAVAVKAAVAVASIAVAKTSVAVVSISLGVSRPLAVAIEATIAVTSIAIAKTSIAVVSIGLRVSLTLLLAETVHQVGAIHAKRSTYGMDNWSQDNSSPSPPGLGLGRPLAVSQSVSSVSVGSVEGLGGQMVGGSSLDRVGGVRNGGVTDLDQLA